ncbi:MAG: hypothetical protein JNJ91_05150 [Flavobacteriales bacterium]|nr:hypothetical protein [Flavobacteriales bacterium]
MTREELRKMYDKVFEDHTLEKILGAEPAFSGYMLRQEKGGRINSVMILFTPEGIVIAGDHAPTRTGMVSNIGYGIEWFAQEQGGEYLMEKFGQDRVFRPDMAIAWLDEYVKEAAPKDVPDAYEIIETRKTLSTGDMAEWEFIGWISDNLPSDAFSGLNIYGYDLNATTKLEAINARFTALYKF